jgi:hypothetical protein
MNRPSFPVDDFSVPAGPTTVRASGGMRGSRACRLPGDRRVWGRAQADGVADHDAACNPGADGSTRTLARAR